MKTVLLLLGLLVLSSAAVSSNLEHQVLHGEKELNKDHAKEIFLQYKEESDLPKLFDSFYNKLQKMIAHNTDPAKTWKMGINQFTFMDDEEFKATSLGAQDCSATAELTLVKKLQKKKKFPYQGDIPTSIDWRTKNVITPVKDQRSCGSCWSFSTTGCLEAHWALKWKNAPILLSEQQLVDCAQDFDNHGCSGGLPSQAFEYIKYNGGLQSEGSYSYYALDGKQCQYQNNFLSALAPGGSVNITAFDEDELLHAVGTTGPVSVAFQVQGDFHSYTSGIYEDDACSTDPHKVNHAVLAVGYGEEKGTPYWIMKNSWSNTWGEDGYFRIKRGVNMCGLADCASFPDVNGLQLEK